MDRRKTTIEQVATWMVALLTVGFSLVSSEREVILVVAILALVAAGEETGYITLS